MVASQAIIITVPASAGGDGGLGMSMDMDMALPMVEPVAAPSRKRRLAHLTMEEKMYRKKLKNRVAAQTSRDRKKAKMDELENSVSAMEDEIVTLKSLNDRLSSENKVLKQQLEECRASQTALMESLLENRCNCGKSQKSNSQAVLTNVSPNTSRPAESMNPLPKGLGETSLVLHSLQIALMACLASQSSLKISGLMKICRILAILQASQKASSKLMRPQNQNRTLSQWWGRHQRSWNPVDRVLVPTLSEA
ncbi:hypothetical protein ONE63_004436 [Megalurothrips usitatus]|uniref:X-box-binding protein 1 n=1 Tax=Megalurothrips usitatus TaxID=439358 RepID=A0AAV7X3L6_9NEOP|nr:hypothetical protein ONE63_004436 [Megalurothrips usitatus]